MEQGKISLVLSGQWGSEAKGKIVGYIANNCNIDIAVCNFMPNAGHTYVHGNKTFMFRQLPVSAINENAIVVLAPTSAIDVNLLNFEVNEFEKVFGYSVHDRLYIDSRAMIISDKHIKEEKNSLYKISSTMKGCGSAFSEKIMRGLEVILAKDSDFINSRFQLCDTSSFLYNSIKAGARCIGELPQGFDLSINHGFKYPYVTSRDITPMQFMNDCGLPFQFLGDVYGVIRTFPIRVGNAKKKEIAVEESDMTNEDIGYSGNYYLDQQEIKWEDVSKIANRSIMELTSVTKRVRRVFTFSENQYKRFLRICAPNKLCITFADYIGFEPLYSMNLHINMELFKDFYEKNRTEIDIFKKIGNVHAQEKIIKIPVLSYVSYGSDNDDTVDFTDLKEGGLCI